MKKVAVFFTNDRGRYYIENIAVFEGSEVPETSYQHEPVRIIDEIEDWNRYADTRDELKNPTTKDGDVFVVVQELEK